MIIRELHLVAFGKFHDKILVFQDGINWIHGRNESGKSTIHKFIEGMFFGFFKDSPTRKVYSEDYDKYMPLRGRDYFGVMMVEKDGRLLRLERNFLKGKDAFHIYDQTTGEDLSHGYPYDSGLRLPVFFEPKTMNRNVFRNTISMGQLKVRTDEELAGELKERIFQFSHTGSSVSLTGALDALKKKREEIGSKTRKSSSLGQQVQRLDELEALWKIARQNRDRLLIWAEEKRKLQEEAHRLEQEEGQLEHRLENMEVKKVHEKYKAYEKLLKERTQWETYLQEQPLPFLSEETYSKALMLHQDRLRLEEEEKLAEKAMAQIQEKLDRDELATEMELDRQRFVVWTKEKARLNRERETLPPKRRKGALALPILAALIALTFGAVGIVYDNFYLLAAAGLFAVAVVYGIRNAMGKRGNQKEGEEEERLRQYGEKMQGMMEGFLKKYEVEDEEALTALWERELMHPQNLRNRMEYIQENREERQRRLDAKIQEFDGLLQQWEIQDMEQLLQLYQRQKRQRRAGDRIRELDGTMDALMTDEEFQRLHLFFTGKAPLGVTREDGEALKMELQQVGGRRSAILEKIHRLEGEMLSLEREGTDLADLEEEMAWVDQKIEEGQRRLKALSIAEEKIEEASKTLHREVAPKLHEYMEAHMKTITGIHRELKVDQGSHLRVEDAETSAMMDADHLSMGAADQLYLAFRLSIIQTLGLDAFPLILDEAFMQFDDERLERAMSLVCGTGSNRQILLFTSQLREKNQLDRLEMTYHPVLL
ncbi:AAA family ATPase [Alkalibacter rhizosphaerae]|uniref:AAA family ATPase n=1 Tax=Alkalibacter rhizosphaerae TaxID=2815577 RepID=A0A974XDT8_9FIRM|nr:AAA family ATPase [Alkalibacter rhizosphaerae]QSX08012.1 AAA family ATPase [Alkalibacter rhizosphaerae]